MNDYLQCGVVEVRGVHDELGTACGRDAKTLCSDCGTSLCLGHTDRCDLCREIFCAACLSFHLADHGKAAHRDASLDPRKKKTA
jgi:hypothetical protein